MHYKKHNIETTTPPPPVQKKKKRDAYAPSLKFK